MDGATLQFMQQVCLTSGPDTMGHWEQGNDEDGEEDEEGMVEATPRRDGYDIDLQTALSPVSLAGSHAGSVGSRSQRSPGTGSGPSSSRSRTGTGRAGSGGSVRSGGTLGRSVSLATPTRDLRTCRVRVGVGVGGGGGEGGNGRTHNHHDP